MAKAVKIASGLLRLPNGKIVFNRRGNTAPTSPNLLAFYGGHVDPGETPLKAMKRELEEETSIDVSKLKMNFVADFEVEETANKRFYLFEIAVSDAKFEVYEGVGSEVFSRTEALSRNDISPSARHALTALIKE